MITIYQGDVLDWLRKLPSESVHCCVTSPPYWNLREYDTATWEGGNTACDHQVGRFTTPCSDVQKGNYGSGLPQAATVCPKCGARRVDRQLGLEQTPEQYIERMVEVFREVRRVLRGDGVLFLNIGDSFAASGPPGGVGKQYTNKGSFGVTKRSLSHGLKPKDLVGIPWALAFALRDAGWYLRSEIIWNKLNPMPESVTDRPTKSHEQVFLLTKSPTYFYDHTAVREKGAGYGRSVWDKPQFKCGDKARHHGNSDGKGSCTHTFEGGRNLRSVWTIPTEAFPGEHYAAFPTKLVEPCVKAGSSQKGCCAKCGSPLERVVEREQFDKVFSAKTKYGTDLNGEGARRMQGSKQAYRNIGLESPPSPVTLGWQPTCDCGTAETRPCTVLDPFGGAGTTSLVANRLGRDSILIELNPRYCQMAKRRIQKEYQLFPHMAQVKIIQERVRLKQ